jgi:hypothetical protein
MRRHIVLIVAAVAAALTVACAATAEQEQDFGAWWHDGKAELDGYRLQISRYGQTRTGHAVMVYVTEPFSASKRVKVNDAGKNPDDTIDVLKLNLVRDFQTGVYDYNTMVSTFVRTSDFTPVKVSFSSAEWCGHVYSELLFDPDAIRGSYTSYFEDESGPFELKRPRGGITQDNLFILLRGLRTDFLEPGKSRTVDYLPGVLYSRLSHHPLQWTRATIARAGDTQTVEVPAGSFETSQYTVTTDDGRTGTFFIEAAYPHRIVKWSLAPDVAGELSGSARLEYWKLHNEGDEKYLDEIGLGDWRR